MFEYERDIHINQIIKIFKISTRYYFLKMFCFIPLYENTYYTTNNIMTNRTRKTNYDVNIR